MVTGDIEMDELKSKLENNLKNWKSGEIPEIEFKKPSVTAKNTSILARPTRITAIGDPCRTSYR